MLTLASRLRIARKHFGHTQDQAGELIGTIQHVVSYWETGRRTPSPKTKVKIEAYIAGRWKGEDVEQTYRVVVREIATVAYEVDAESREEARAAVYDPEKRPQRYERLEVHGTTRMMSIQVWKDGKWEHADMDWRDSFTPNDRREREEMAHDEQRERWV